MDKVVVVGCIAFPSEPWDKGQPNRPNTEVLDQFLGGSKLIYNYSS